MMPNLSDLPDLHSRPAFRARAAIETPPSMGRSAPRHDGSRLGRAPGADPWIGSPEVRPAATWRESLEVVAQHVPFERQSVKADDPVYRCGRPFDKLYLVNLGLCKIVNLTPDGREQTVGISFRGDWLGLDEVAGTRHACSAIALDTGELWSVRQHDLLTACAEHPQVLRMLLAAMGEQLARKRDAMLSICTLSADARVAAFLLQWAQSLAERGLRTDQINIHLTRAEIGNYLGLRLESVSRAMSRLATAGVIHLNERSHREIAIPALASLQEFIEHSALHEHGALHEHCSPAWTGALHH